jgi:uridine phosphorylase
MKATDLIINPDGSIYHLKLRPEELPDLVLVAGDPARIRNISKNFDNIEFRRTNREFVSHAGTLNGRRILALSTGIGPDNIDIVMNELDALANIDFKTRTIKDKLRRLQIIRIGTSGTFHPDIRVGSLAVATHGLGLDGSLNFYRKLQEVKDGPLTRAFLEQTSWPTHLPIPYIISGSEALVRKIDAGEVRGIAATGAGFYGPQGRELRLAQSFPGLFRALADFRHDQIRVVNFEMETSSLYGLGRMLGHETASICVILANRATGEYNKSDKVIQRMIRHVLEHMTN